MKTEYINLQIHPRGIEALGKDLVTNNIVAMIELVKNSYDAFAQNVYIDFEQDNKGKFIKISDDGIGMDEDIIRNAWAVIATPYKSINTY